MSEAVELFRAMKDARKYQRTEFGVECPVCKIKRPKTNAKILLPQQTCRAHKPHYKDERSDLDVVW